MAETANVVVERTDANIRVIGTGALDLTNSQQFRDELEQASQTADGLKVDLTGASFIDTAILEYLARAARTMNKRDKRLTVVVAENTHPLQVLRIVGFSAVMDIEAVPHEA